MNRKAAAVLVLVLSLGLLSGCQLAQAGMDNQAGDDKLIGAFVTFEYLDLFDFESFAQDNTRLLTKSGDVYLDNADPRYNGRLYADKTVRQVPDESGVLRDEVSFEFEGVDGISFYCPNISLGGDSWMNSHYSPVVGEGISPDKMNLGSSIELEGTIYVGYGDGAMGFYLNPVYQDSEENIYITSGECMYSASDIPGGKMTQSLSHTISVTMDGGQVTWETVVSVSMAVIYPPEKIGVIMMDADNEIVSARYYSPGEVPGAFKCSGNTEYVLIESHGLNLEGEPSIDRSLYPRGEANFKYFTEINGGILAETPSELIWN